LDEESPAHIVLLDAYTLPHSGNHIKMSLIFIRLP